MWNYPSDPANTTVQTSEETIPETCLSMDFSPRAHPAPRPSWQVTTADFRSSSLPWTKGAWTESCLESGNLKRQTELTYTSKNIVKYPGKIYTYRVNPETYIKHVRNIHLYTCICVYMQSHIYVPTPWHLHYLSTVLIAHNLDMILTIKWEISTTFGFVNVLYSIRVPCTLFGLYYYKRKKNKWNISQESTFESKHTHPYTLNRSRSRAWEASMTLMEGRKEDWLPSAEYSAWDTGCTWCT